MNQNNLAYLLFFIGAVLALLGIIGFIYFRPYRTAQEQERIRNQREYYRRLQKEREKMYDGIPADANLSDGVESVPRMAEKYSSATPFSQALASAAIALCRTQELVELVERGAQICYPVLSDLCGSDVTPMHEYVSSNVVVYELELAIRNLRLHKNSIDILHDVLRPALSLEQARIYDQVNDDIVSWLTKATSVVVKARKQQEQGT